MPFKKLFIYGLMVFICGAFSATAAEYRQVSGLIDTRSSFSDGNLDFEAMTLLARKRGFDALFFNDHDRLAVEYGIFPLRNILKKKVELNSINKQGAEKYLQYIKRAREKYPDMILIPGSESSPFYYWQGSFFSRNLTVHDHEKRILTVGMERPEDYQDLPVLHNGFSTRFAKNFLPALTAFLITLLLGLLLLRRKGAFRILGIIITASSALLMINAHPFKSSPFDPYHGSQGIKPYQMLIDYVDSRGGLTFWNYPETRSGKSKKGPVYFNTPPYPEALEQSVNYTGFAALYGDNITATEPGEVWDRVLLAFCRGERKRPVWGIATADFHKDGGAGQKLGDFPTVFLVRKKTKEDILTAMRAGRMYACLAKYPQQIVLKEFSVYSSRSGKKATLGEEIQLSNYPRVSISLALKKPDKKPVMVRLIRSGKLIKAFSGPLPMEIDYEDPYYKPGQKIYYRIDVKGPGVLVSNPIFVTFN